MAPLTARKFATIPQRSDIVPNPAGTHAFFLASVETISSLYVVDLAASQPILISQDPISKTLKWTGEGTQVAWTKSSDETTEIWIGDVEHGLNHLGKAAEIPGYYTLLDISPERENVLGVLLLGKCRNAHREQPSSVKTFTSLPVLDFDGYAEKPRSTLWYGRLEKSDRSKDSFCLPPSNFRDVLWGTNLSFDPHPEATPFGPISCAMSRDAIAFTAIACEPSKPGEWSSTLYYVSKSSLIHSKPALLKGIATPTHTGQCLLPAFSPSGDKIAFTRGETKANPWARRVIYVMSINESYAREVEMVDKTTGQPVYLEVETMMWSQDEISLLICSTRYGRRTLVNVSTIEGATNMPQTLIQDLNVSSLYRLPDDRLLLSSSSFTCPSEFLIYHIRKSERVTLNKIDLSHYEIREDQVSEVICKGIDGEDIQSWLVRPSSFQSDQKYPLCMFIHGGPPMAWTNSWQWSRQWSPLLLAEQGHVVILPNFRGSVGVSENFKKVFGRLGSIPCQDLETCMQFVRTNLDYVDYDRATAIGGSFGGYLAFWIAGQPFAKQFKALVSHAGMFTAPSMAASDVPDTWRLFFGGLESSIQDPMAAFNRCDPARYSQNWTTPTLISVGEKDRRIPFTHGVGAFSALQLRGVESRLLVFPDEGHFILKPSNTLKWYEEVIDWINAHTGVAQDAAGNK